MNNISIKCLKSEEIESGSCHGQFLINSLKLGQGITMGNQLRRVLLGDLGGVAITAVRIAGISHEFSILPGVREDILEILLQPQDELHLVPVPDHSSAEPQELADLAKQVCPQLSNCQTYDELFLALQAVWNNSQNQESLVVLCGSLYLIGHFFRQLR